MNSISMVMSSAKSGPVGSPESRQRSSDVSGYSVQIEKREQNIGDITCDICGNPADPEFSDEEHALCRTHAEAARRDYLVKG